MNADESLMHEIVACLNSLEALGVNCTFRTEEGWGRSLCFGRDHCLGWTPEQGWYLREM